MPPTSRFATQWLRLAAAGCLAVTLLACPSRAEDAPKPTPPTEQPRRAPGGQGDASQYLPILRERLNALDLSAEQKTKVDAIFAKAADDLKKAQAENKDATQQERGQKIREVLGGIKTSVGEVLTDEQKGKAAQLLPGGQGPGGAARPGAALDNLSKNLEKLDLSDDQKAKVKNLIDDTRKSMEDLRADAVKDGANRDALREKAMNLTKDMRGRLAEILTPEQGAKLQELMAASRPTPPTGKPAAVEKKGS